jgi:hypothetical protein
MSTRLHALFITASVLAIVGAGCRNQRTLAELEQVLEELEEERTPIADVDPLSTGLARVRRLFVGPHEVLIPEQRVHLAPRSSHDHVVELAAGDCYAVAAWAPPTMDVNLEITDPGGRIVAFDRTPDSFPVVDHLCVETTGLHAIRLRAPRRSGEVAWGAWRLLDTPIVEASRALRAQAHDVHPEAIAVGPARRIGLADGRAVEAPLALLPDRCYVVVARTAAIDDLDLALFDREGEPVVRDIALNDTPHLGPWCPDTAGIRRLELRSRSGDGVVTWQLFETPTP